MIDDVVTVKRVNRCDVSRRNSLHVKLTF